MCLSVHMLGSSQEPYDQWGREVGGGACNRLTVRVSQEKQDKTNKQKDPRRKQD